MLTARIIAKQFTKSKQNNNYILFIRDNIYLYVLNKKTSKRTIVHLEESGDIIFEQLYLFGGMTKPVRQKSFTLKPLTEKNIVTIVLYRGKPLLVKRLDENNYVSSEERYKNGNILFVNEQNLEKALVYFNKTK